ncbi:MCE family protein, partial [Nocardioides massiliensis]
MTRLRRTRLVGVLAAAVTVLTSCSFTPYDIPLPGGADLGDDPITVTVQLRDAMDLVPQSVVKVDDVNVGRVDEVELDDYTARVTVRLRKDVELPDNAMAEIRQTSLLGEKFVSLRAPATGASEGRLDDGDVIPLERTGRNPEVEEVFGAMSLVLNGGGIAQLRTISQEINSALEGREGTVKSVLSRIDTFMTRLDAGRGEIVEAIERLNDLAIVANEQRGSIELALDELPDAVASIDRQRDDLVKVLGALDELSAASVEVIRTSKQGTVDSLRALDPVLTKLAEAGQALPDSLSTLWTYPFVDEVIGRNPTAARNLHIGDYTNLAVQMDVDLANGLPTLPGLPPIPQLGGLPVVGDLLGGGGAKDGGNASPFNAIQRCLLSGDADSALCESLKPKQLKQLCAAFPRSPLTTALCPGQGAGGTNGGAAGGAGGGATGG